MGFLAPEFVDLNLLDTEYPPSGAFNCFVRAQGGVQRCKWAKAQPNEYLCKSLKTPNKLRTKISQRIGSQKLYPVSYTRNSYCHP